MTLSQFRDRFPEFSTASNGLVQACLDAAAAETSSEALGTAYDEAHGLLAAHKLSISPMGGMARLDAGQETTYQRERRDLVQRVVIGVGVAVWPEIAPV